MAIQISEADLSNPHHATGVIEVLDSYARDPVGGGRPLSSEVRSRLIPELRAQPAAVVLLAFDRERPVGAAVCFLGFSTFAARPLLNIHDLAVLPEYRGRGIGKSLLGAAEARAQDLGCCKLTLEVRQDNDAARGLYKSFGFGDFAPGDEATPTLFLEKRVQSTTFYTGASAKLSGETDSESGGD